MKFFITKHCKERYIERVLGGLNSSSNILLTILRDLDKGKNITSELSTKLPRFILYLKERYGKDKGYNIIENNNTLFILIKRKGTNDLYDVITCYVDIDIYSKFSTCLTNKEIYLRLATL